MTALSAIWSGRSKADVPIGLSERLVWLKRFGRPRVSCFKDGAWGATIEMHVSAKGATFDIKSDFDCATPDAAIDQAIERMLDTLSKIGFVP